MVLWPLACRKGQQRFCTGEFRGQTEALCVKADFSMGRKGTEELLAGNRKGTEAALCPGRPAQITLGT